MPVEGRYRNNFGGPRQHFRGRPNTGYVTSTDQPRNERRYNGFYHVEQQSAQMANDMSEKLRLGKEQKRLADAKQLCGDEVSVCPEVLRKHDVFVDVTLTIEVPSADYPTIVGLLDANIDEDSVPKIMSDTGVRIQFPVISDRKANLSTVNQVKLIGPLPKVEDARKRIRKLSPVTVAFCIAELVTTSSEIKDVVESIALGFPNLRITMDNRPAFITYFFRALNHADWPIFMVKGPMLHEDDIYEACTQLCDTFLNYKGTPSGFVSFLDIPLAQQRAVTGFPDGYLMRIVSQKTGAAIYFPNPGDRQFGATMFYFTGLLRSVISARRYIQGLLPVRLTVDVDHSDIIDAPVLPDRRCCFREETLDVRVSIGRSPLEGERIFDDDPYWDRIEIESTEHNLTNAYEMRRRLLRSAASEVYNRPDDYDFIDAEFRQIVTENNKFIAEGARGFESMVPVATASRIPIFDPKVPAPFNASQNRGQVEVWRDGLLPPQQAPLFRGIPTAPPLFAPTLLFPQAAPPRFAAPLHATASLPTFNCSQYHSPSTTAVSDDRSLPDNRTDHSQCSSKEAPATAVQQLFDSFRSRDSKAGSYSNRKIIPNRSTQYM